MINLSQAPNLMTVSDNDNEDWYCIMTVIITAMTMTVIMWVVLIYIKEKFSINTFSPKQLEIKFSRETTSI